MLSELRLISSRSKSGRVGLSEGKVEREKLEEGRGVQERKRGSKRKESKDYQSKQESGFFLEKAESSLLFFSALLLFFLPVESEARSHEVPNPT